MQKHLTLFLITLSTLLVSCTTQQFYPKTLNENAKGIATVRTTPYGCKVLGEIEGKDEIPNIQQFGVLLLGDTLLSLREGAMNDLRNNAINVIGDSKKRTVLKITNGRALCHDGSSCPDQNDTNQRIQAYYVTAEVFECADK